MSEYIPPDAVKPRLILFSLGVDFLPKPVEAPAPEAPPIPAIWRAIAQRVIEFEYASEYVLNWMLWDINHTLRTSCEEFIDRDDPDALLAEAAHYIRRLRADCLTAEEHFELERWIDFLPDAYAAREEAHDAWNAKRAKKRASALKGAETRRRNREAKAVAQ